MEELRRIMKDRQMSEAFAQTFFEQIQSDEASFQEIGYYAAKAYLDNDIDSFLIAICGWSMDSILELFKMNRGDSENENHKE